MLVYFNTVGQLQRQLEYKTLAYLSTTNYTIFAVQDEYEYQENDLATLSLKRPDGTLLNAEILGKYKTMKFEKPSELTSEQCTPFVDGETYGGFEFAIDDMCIFDQVGTWKGTIAFNPTNKARRNLSGVITIYVNEAEINQNGFEMNYTEYSVLMNKMLELETAIGAIGTTRAVIEDEIIIKNIRFEHLSQLSKEYSEEEEGYVDVDYDNNDDLLVVETNVITDKIVKFIEGGYAYLRFNRPRKGSPQKRNNLYGFPNHFYYHHTDSGTDKPLPYNDALEKCLIRVTSDDIVYTPSNKPYIKKKINWCEWKKEQLFTVVEPQNAVHNVSCINMKIQNCSYNTSSKFHLYKGRVWKSTTRSKEIRNNGFYYHGDGESKNQNVFPFRGGGDETAPTNEYTTVRQEDALITSFRADCEFNEFYRENSEFHDGKSTFINMDFCHDNRAFVIFYCRYYEETENQICIPRVQDMTLKTRAHKNEILRESTRVNFVIFKNPYKNELGKKSIIFNNLNETYAYQYVSPIYDKTLRTIWKITQTDNERYSITDPGEDRSVFRMIGYTLLK